MRGLPRQRRIWILAAVVCFASWPGLPALAQEEAKGDGEAERPSDIQRALGDLRRHREEVRRQTELLEAQLRARHAEMEAIEAKMRLLIAEQEVREVAQSLETNAAGREERESHSAEGREPERDRDQTHSNVLKGPGAPEAMRRRLAELKERIGREQTEAKANVLISHALTKKLTMPFPDPTPLEEVIRYIKKNTVSEALPSGIPIWVDPDGLDRAGERLSSKIRFTSAEAPLRETLPKVLEQLNLRYVIEDGLLKIKDLGEGQN